jgi:hypothetical protein
VDPEGQPVPYFLPEVIQGPQDLWRHVVTTDPTWQWFVQAYNRLAAQQVYGFLAVDQCTQTLVVDIPALRAQVLGMAHAALQAEQATIAVDGAASANTAAAMPAQMLRSPFAATAAATTAAAAAATAAAATTALSGGVASLRAAAPSAPDVIPEVVTGTAHPPRQPHLPAVKDEGPEAKCAIAADAVAAATSGGMLLPTAAAAPTIWATLATDRELAAATTAADDALLNAASLLATPASAAAVSSEGGVLEAAAEAAVQPAAAAAPLPAGPWATLEDLLTARGALLRLVELLVWVLRGWPQEVERCLQQPRSVTAAVASTSTSSSGSAAQGGPSNITGRCESPDAQVRCVVAHGVWPYGGQVPVMLIACG